MRPVDSYSHVSPGAACVPKSKLASAVETKSFSQEKLASAVGTKSFSWEKLASAARLMRGLSASSPAQLFFTILSKRPSSALRAPSPGGRFEKTLMRPLDSYSHVSPEAACVPKTKLASAVRTKTFSWEKLASAARLMRGLSASSPAQLFFTILSKRPSSTLRAPSPWRRFEKTLIRSAGA